MSGHSPEWPPERVMRLAAMWDEGLSAAVIGLRMGMSRNSIIGKSHRLGLPPRPSPIRPSSGVPYRKAREDRPKRMPNGLLVAGIPTLAPLASLARKAPPHAPTRHTPSIVPPKAERPIRVPQDKPERPNEPARQCAWLDGERGSYLQCDAPAKSGSPYCVAHHARCYIRPRDRREDYVLRLVA